METEIINKLFLELSQITTAETETELKLKQKLLEFGYQDIYVNINDLKCCANCGLWDCNKHQCGWIKEYNTSLLNEKDCCHHWMTDKWHLQNRLRKAKPIVFS